MATEKEKSRGTVRTSPDMTFGWTSPRDGWAFPRRLDATWEDPDGRVTATVVVEGDEGKAVARSITVRTDAERGLGWRALGKVPMRDIAATAVLAWLRKVTQPHSWEGPMQLAKPEPDDVATVREIIQAAVGYRPRTEGFVTLPEGGEQPEERSEADQHQALVERAQRGAREIKRRGRPS